MANYSLVTVSKGEIKNSDAWIKAYNSVGHNLTVLAVTAYKMYELEEDKEKRIQFKTDVLDRTSLGDSSFTNLKDAGWLFTIDDRFSLFSYTNVIYFKKLVKALEKVDEAHITKMFNDLATFCNSYVDGDGATFLASLSQKELRNAIDKFIKGEKKKEEKPVEAKKEENPVEELEVEVVEDSEEVEEINNHLITVTDDELNAIISSLLAIDMNSTKKNIANEINNVAVMVDALMRK